MAQFTDFRFRDLEGLRPSGYDDLRISIDRPGSYMQILEVTLSHAFHFRANHRKRQWRVPSKVNGQPVSAFPDSGSTIEVISETFAKSLNAIIDEDQSKMVEFPKGKRTRTCGTTKLPFSFGGEAMVHNVVFHVIKSCTHDCILGAPFLWRTKTLTKYFKRRIQEKLVQTLAPLGLNLMNAPQERLLGTINGTLVRALADTGADVNVMSEGEARRLGVEVHREDLYQATLEFADGSTARTSGMVLGARTRMGIEDAHLAHFLDFHVLDDLPCGVILGNEFLYDNDVFVRYEKYFDADDIDISDDDAAHLSVISLRQDYKARIAKELEETHRRIDADTRIFGMPEDEQEEARVAENTRRSLWDIGQTNASSHVPSTAENIPQPCLVITAASSTGEPLSTDTTSPSTVSIDPGGKTQQQSRVASKVKWLTRLSHRGARLLRQKDYAVP